jgi:hypothetical protein
MLLMFLFAAFYIHYRKRGVLLGCILFLLANTNASSVLLVGGFLLVWFADVVSASGLRWGKPLQIFLVNFGIASAGAIASFASLYPPTADAIPVGFHFAIEPTQVALAVLEPARTLREITGIHAWEAIGLGEIGYFIMSMVLFGSILGLVRSPGALFAALGVLVGLSLFFLLVFAGIYRHQALWLVFLLTMFWIAAEQDKWRSALQPISNIRWTKTVALGSALMVVLFAMQTAQSYKAIVQAGFGGLPRSRSRDLGDFIKHRPDLEHATVIADPDYLLEALPYYIDNPTYLIREQRFGNVVAFTTKSLLNVELDDVLENARKLAQERGEPVVILLAQPLDPDQPQGFSEGYDWRFSTTPDQVRRFLAATRLLGRFSPALSDESFDAYLFDKP